MKKSVLLIMFTAIFNVMTISAENSELFPNVPAGGNVTSTFINIEDGNGKINQYNLSDYAAYLMNEKLLDENLNSTINQDSELEKDVAQAVR